MKTRTIIVIVLAVAIAIGLSVPLVSAYAGSSGGFLGYRPSSQSNTQQPGYNGMMGGSGYGGMMGGSSYGGDMMGGNENGGIYGGMMAPTSTIDNQTVSSSYSTPPSGVTVNRATNTISIDASGVTLPIEAAPIWYPQSGDFWLIYGLVNPEIVVNHGETVHFLFINMDNETHMPAITTLAPPYQYMPMMQDSGMQNMMSGMMGGASSSGPNQGATSSNDWLAIGPMMSGVGNPASTVYSGVTLSVTFSSTGTFWYLCLYPGHAQMGMYGKILVVG
ncbi:MAG: hypothetical protein JRN20_21600 [Nitrososphaerota archaeon]|nr:hypothetical protein [Nitrososphaerota archaeon]